MSRTKSPETRQASRNRKNAGKFPELVNAQSDLDAHLERESNKIRFGRLEPRNDKQDFMMKAIDEKRIIFVTGPAGTGKTFVATSMACEMLEAHLIDKIIICRPMVGCEEEMGFIPGTEFEKFSQWLGPFFDVLEGKLGKTKVESYFKFKKIMAMPLMTMRGATFRNAMVILDEAQNTTPGQMKMFLTRIGEGAKVVLDGDLEQTDLPKGKMNGLADALEVLGESNSAAFVDYNEDEITRDPLVRDIVLAYRHRK